MLASLGSAQTIYTTVDGRTVVYPDVEPMMMNSRVMVPLRGVFEHMGANVDWNGTMREVTVTDGGDVVKLRVGSSTANVNGQLVTLDAPAVMVRNRVMVPLRFISESFGHDVFWNAPTRTVEITTVVAEGGGGTGTMMTIRRDTVVPFRLQTSLSSSSSRVGDRFTATINTNGESDYEGLPVGTVLEGHVGTVRARTSGAPGVIGLEFDRVRLPGGAVYNLDGSLIQLDAKSVIRESDGTIRARDDAPDDLKWVGYGAGAGILVAILTDGNLLTDALIGAALGFILGTQIDRNRFNNVSLQPGTEFGVRLDRDLVFRAGQ
jgi:hypothetical protein